MAGNRGIGAIGALTLRPGSALRLAGVMTALAGAFAVLVALLVPASDVRFHHDLARGVVTFEQASGARTIDPQARLDLSRGGRTITVSAGAFADPENLDPATQDRIDALFGEGAVRVTLHGESEAFAIGRKRPQLSDLDAQFWLLLLSALAGLGAGLAVYVLRPRTWAGTTYAVLGVTLFISAAITALGPLTDGGTPAQLLRAMGRINFLVLQVFELGWLAFFARFPHGVIPRGGALAMLAVLAAIALPFNLWAGMSAELRGFLQVGTYVVMLGLLAAQFLLARRHPAQRRSLYIILGCIGVGTLVYLLLTVLPTITALRLPFNDVALMPLYVLIYCGIGLAIVRTRLFGFDGWVRHVFAAICLVGAVLLIDMLLVNWLTRQDETVLGLSIVIVALLYWPIRERIVRRGERERDARMRTSFRLAADVSFAVSPAQRAQSWREAVEATFQPLEIAVDPIPAASPCVSPDGESLRLPPIGSAPALICRHAGGGQRLFGLDDVAAAEALLVIVDQLTRSREAYMHGVAEERRRIARDLHDDVSGRLMTSLHRGEVDAMRRDVRDAMADIRTIVTGLAHEPRSLPDLLADLRHETMGRLEGTGIVLDWPIGSIPLGGPPLPYQTYRHITSILRETISNAVRHACPAVIRVGVKVEDGALQLEISDDGASAQQSDGHAAGGGNGLANCRRRAEEMGGHFDFVKDAKGARAVFSAPL